MSVTLKANQILVCKLHHNVLAEDDTDEDKPDYIRPETSDFLDGYEESFTQSPPTVPEDQSHDILTDTYAAMTDAPSARSAIAATYRGFCSELFVFGTCHRRDSGCPLDHSSAGQERCIQSFYLLPKRELTLHSKLPPWAPNKPAQSSFATPRPTMSASGPEQRTNYRPGQRNETSHPRTSNSQTAPNRHTGAYASSRPFST